MKQLRSPLLHLAALSAAFFSAAAVMNGCEVDSFFDPSKTLYGQHYPATSPILDRIDAIERGAEQEWANATDVTPEDLLPSDLDYRLTPGDVVTVNIFELLRTGEWLPSTRQVDQSGNIRLPVLGDIRAAGLTVRELEDNVIDDMRVHVREPIVYVVLERGQGYFFTVSGNIAGPGTYPLTRPDLRLDQALGFAGGAPFTTEYIYIVRPVTLSSEYEAFPDRPRPAQPTVPNGPTQPIDIEDLLRDVEGGGRGRDDGGGGVNPGSLGRNNAPTNEPAGPPAIETADLDPIQIVDIDNLELRRLSDDANVPAREFVSRAAANRQRPGAGGASFMFVEDRGWVAASISTQDAMVGDDVLDQMFETPDAGEMVVERIIRVPYQKLLSDGRYNVVIRPGDRLYVSPPRIGVVYVGGEIARPGVYQLPSTGKLTLSRLITAAGGFGPLAIPSRIDFTRRVGEDRDATIRLNLGAIRQKTEPDIFLRADDHIIVGTSWVAAPLAVIRNGFRATYGFGFLLDRNFGSDVFGAPPTNRGQ